MVTQDEELIQEMRNGNQQAFEQIIEGYKAYVCAIILSITGNSEEVQDIAQEVFLQVYRSFATFKEGSFKSWIGRITVNKSIDWKRAISRTSSWQETRGDLESILASSHSDSPEQAILNQEEMVRLQKTCSTLPPRYAEVIYNFYYQGKGYQEIAAEEGISPRTVESRLYRARSLLRQKWREGG